MLGLCLDAAGSHIIKCKRVLLYGFNALGVKGLSGYHEGHKTGRGNPCNSKIALSNVCILGPNLRGSQVYVCVCVASLSLHP